MKRSWVILILFITGLDELKASTMTEPDLPAAFLSANEWYDSGDFSGAMQGYLDIIQQGYSNLETWYNAANAAFRAGYPGQAVLFYRRAWYYNPRDPDVLANQRLAQQRTGSATLEPALWDRAAQELSHREWTRLFKIGYWMALSCAAVMLFIPGLRLWLKPVGLAAVAMTLISLGGWFYWNHWQRLGEAVVLSGTQTALYEPRSQATPFFSLPEGSLVVVEETFDSWVKVRSGNKSGWVQGNAIQKVYPWIR